MTHAAITAIEYFLPGRVETSEDLSSEFPEWEVEKIAGKTGVRKRHLAAPDECSSDLAVRAAEQLFRGGTCAPEAVDYVLLCTQSPDHFLPTTACLVQDRLGIRTSAGALDFCLGSSGYVYGIGLAHGLIASGQALTVLLLTAETYSKFIHPGDRSVRTIFGDAATATLVGAVDADRPFLGPFVYGTDGKGGPNLIVPAGGMRTPRTVETAVAAADDSGNVRSRDNLYMNGAEVFNFTLTRVPRCISELLEKAGFQLENIDLFVFHQANAFMLEHLRKKLKIPPEKFVVAMEDSGNTGSCTIPIALKHAWNEGRVAGGSTVMLVGYGPGYSWGGAILRWR